MWICIAPCREHTSKALRYDTHSQGISQFYLNTPRSSTNRMNLPAFAFPDEAGTHLRTPEGWKAGCSQGQDSTRRICKVRCITGSIRWRHQILNIRWYRQVIMLSLGGLNFLYSS